MRRVRVESSTPSRIEKTGWSEMDWGRGATDGGRPTTARARTP